MTGLSGAVNRMLCGAARVAAVVDMTKADVDMPVMLARGTTFRRDPQRNVCQLDDKSSDDALLRTAKCAILREAGRALILRLA